MDQDRLARADSGAANDHPPGRLVGQRKSGRLLEGQPLRNRKQVARRNDDVLGEGSPRVLAQDPVSRAQALLAGEAHLARAAEEARLDEHAVARREARDPLAERVDDARGVRARNLREWHVRDSVAHEDVEPVERRRPHGHAHVAGPGLRRRQFAVLQHVVAAVLFEEDGFHRKSRVKGRGSSVGSLTLDPRLSTLDSHCRYPRLLSFSRYSWSPFGAVEAGGATRGP